MSDNKLSFWKTLLGTVKDFFDLATKAIKVYSGVPVAINEKVLDRVRAERQAFSDFELAPIAADPLAGFSIGDLLDPNLPTALESVSNFESKLLDFERSLETRSNELSALGALSAEWADQLESCKRCFLTTFREWSRSVRLPILYWDRRSACVWT
ncbi:MAG: hypothetical protein E5X34_02865 [Mesorhizobium sp.]|uniref:hypothetical protein n=1 Tax=Mesorhizobium sp. TaxID=1871066 RepID=UPI00121025AB|nr:hypothetical protein [Mesorhizobium sp.]TIR26595.1 MAG: hypothetical protein E5X34_02865 [Mesorhizobium sp.]